MLDEVLVEQAQVGKNAHCHVRVYAGLELKEYVEVKPVVFDAQAPDYVVLAVAQVVSHVAATHDFKRIEVQIGYPTLMNKARQQVSHHFGVREQELVAVVVLGHGAGLVSMPVKYGGQGGGVQNAVGPQLQLLGGGGLQALGGVWA